ncbi:TPA: hypothetical protein HA251_05490 [Candidatus Woesearchaeota archaeon]|nr:hypothetical protein [Candidatus Woesearchaeota archaeon]
MTIIVLCANVDAMVVSDVTIDDTLEQDAVRETITVDLENNTLPAIKFSLPEGARDVVVNGRRVDPVNGSVDIALSCIRCSFSIVYVLPGVVVVEGPDLRSFSRTLNLPASPENMDYLLRLPEGSTVSAIGSEPSIVPSPTELRTDGQRIIVRWTRSHPALPERYFVRYSDDAAAHEEGSFLSELLEWPVWVLIGVALAIGIAAGMGAQRHLHERFREDESLPFVPYKLLSPDERIVVKLLEAQDVIDQKEVGKRLSWSKSKVSAIMTGLEHKEVVSREKVGRNYKVKLEKAIKE